MAPAIDQDSAARGLERTEFAGARMPVMAEVVKERAPECPLSGLRCTIAIHITSETAVLALALQALGAAVTVCSSNSKTASGDVVAYLRARGIRVEYDGLGSSDSVAHRFAHFRAALRGGVDIVIDDGAELIKLLHEDPEFIGFDLVGALEETTSGVRRVDAISAEGRLRFPVVNVNDAATKHYFDNRYGTGQSTIDAILRATNLLIAGARVHVAGYGYCGKGVASVARGLGAKVQVSETDPVAALEAHFDGFEVIPLDLSRDIDVLVTATGSTSIVTASHWGCFRNGAVIANCGHFSSEIDLESIADSATGVHRISDDVVEYMGPTGVSVRVLADGEVVNLALANGNPPELMDMSFANQLIGTLWIAEHGPSMKSAVHPIPREIDRGVASSKLANLGLVLQEETQVQIDYRSSNC